jgi:alginate O-acetyltransferase complex protein AlgI
MSFTSISFAIFFAVLLALYALAPPRWRKPVLLAGGLFFYAYWDWHFLALIGSCIVADYYLARLIFQAGETSRKRAYLAVSVTLNLGLLAFFKYYNFFVSSANLVLGQHGVRLPELAIILPVGISFFTFESMSYTLDVYRGSLTPCDNILDFALFIAFFPRLVAGPIIRASHFLPQLQRPLGLRSAAMRAGALIFLSGLVKKILLADNLAPFVDRVFSAPQEYHPVTHWLAVLAYAMQIYYDFSGYSDMAVGIARALGFELPINFSAPYAARNVAEFWHRWHISLSTWLRDYLYIPLGGSRKGSARTTLNLMLTMLLGGLWHGASWNFVLWGGLHGLGLVWHRSVSSRFPRLVVPDVVARLATVLFVALLWVPFRAANGPTALLVMERLIGRGGGAIWLYPWCFVAAAVCITTSLKHRAGEPDFFTFQTESFLGRTQVAFAVMSLLYLSPLNVSPFVYFQF